jgi:hypothetical protein
MISTMQSYNATATLPDYFDFATVAELEQQFFALPSSDFDSSKKPQSEDDLMILDDLLVGYSQHQFSGYESFDALFGAPDPLTFSGHFDFKEEPRIPSASLAVELPRSLSSVSTASSSSCYSSSLEPRAAGTAPASRSMPLDPAARRRERNRLAAERCRQRKTGRIESLQKECDDLRRQKEQLLKENERLLRALRLKF